jgi:pyruvate formate lyase activating enzyme
VLENALRTIVDETDRGRLAGQPPLRIGGIVPFSTADWPGKLCAVVFTQGCPWRCGYCHNPHLLAGSGEAEENWAATLDWLDTRQNMLDGVVFSGGEPTAQPALAAAVRAVRERGFAVGLHTGGAYPRRLVEIVHDLDWVGLDIKAPMLAYDDVTDVPTSGLAAFASLDLLTRMRVSFEVRTTVHLAVTTPSMLVDLARELAAAGVTSWVLQMFRETGCASKRLVELAHLGRALDPPLLARLREHVPHIAVR